MKKVKILLACLILATSSWAATTIYPTADRLCRSKNANEWEKLGSVMTPVDPSESYTTFELKYQSKLYAIMQFEVPNFKAVKTMSFIFTKDNAATLMGVWNYSGYNMPENNGSSATYTYQKVTKVIGVEPGSTDGTNLIEPLAQGDNKDGVWTFAIDANTIAPTVVYKEDGTTAVVQLLLTTYNPATRDKASKIFAYNTDQTKTPHLDVEYINYAQPYMEYNYRFKVDGEVVSYQTKKNGSELTQFEINFNKSFVVIETFAIKDFDKSQNYALKLFVTKAVNVKGYNFGEFDYASIAAADLKTMIENKIGITMGAQEGTPNEPDFTCTRNGSSDVTIALTGDKLVPLYTDVCGNTYFNLLLINDNVLTDNQQKIYTTSAEETLQPILSLTNYANVYNETQELTYDNLQAAYNAAAANDIIRVNNDLTTDARININEDKTTGRAGYPVVIKGRTPETKINFTTRGALMFTIQTSDKSKSYIKNITLVNKSTDPRNIHGIEVNTPLELENVTFVSDPGYNEGKCDVQAKQANVTLVGNNVMPGGIRVENGKRIDDGIDNASPRTTHTTPIAITMASIAENTMVVAHGWGARRDMYQLTNEGYALYVVAGSGDLKAFAVQPISLSETEDNAELIAKYKGISTDITLSRTFVGSATDYSTICLPFETSIDELGAAEVYEFINATIEGQDLATLHFEPTTDLEAGKPYLVRFAEDKENPTFEGKTITAATPGKYGDENYKFIGLFSKTKITETEDKSLMYLGNSNTLYWAGENCTIKGSRGYFKAVSAPAQAARRVAISSYNAPTDMRSMHAVKATKTIINGQFVIVKDNKMFNAQGQIIK